MEFRVRKWKKGVTLRVSSHLSLMERVTDECRAYFNEVPAHQMRDLTVVLQELVGNAILHGNQRLPDRRVTCMVETSPDGSIKAVVEDEGHGWDWGELDECLPEDPKLLLDHGYGLVKSVCDRVEFNDKGNRVAVRISADSEEGPVPVSRR